MIIHQHTPLKRSLLLSNTRHVNEKKRIIDTATEIIAANGLGNFRIDTLTEKLGYSRQNIYRYYPSRRAILDAVIVEGSRAMALKIGELLTDKSLPFDEQIIEGVLIACQIIHGDRNTESYSGKNLAVAINLFMENATGVQQALHVYLEPIYSDAKAKDEIYTSMSYKDITKWLFQIVLSELLSFPYETIEVRRQFLLKMFSPSINAKKAKENTAGINLLMTPL